MTLELKLKQEIHHRPVLVNNVDQHVIHLLNMLTFTAICPIT